MVLQANLTTFCETPVHDLPSFCAKRNNLHITIHCLNCCFRNENQYYQSYYQNSLDGKKSKRCNFLVLNIQFHRSPRFKWTIADYCSNWMSNSICRQSLGWPEIIFLIWIMIHDLTDDDEVEAVKTIFDVQAIPCQWIWKVTFWSATWFYSSI